MPQVLPWSPPKPLAETTPEVAEYTPGEQTQALAALLSALGQVDAVDPDGGRGSGQSEGDAQDSAPRMGGADVLRLLEADTRAAIQDEADAWARALPPHDVVFAGPTTHDVYRARAASFIQTETQFRPTGALTPRHRALPEDAALRDQIVHARFSLEEQRANPHRRQVP